MSAFNETALQKKLGELNNSQQSIQTLSLWLIHHRKHHKAIVRVWFKELRKVVPKRKLTFMYLANDVIQNSKKKGPEFIKEFRTILLKAFNHVSENADEKTRGGLERILSVWEERNVYNATHIASFRQAMIPKEDTVPADIEPVSKKKKVESIIPLKEDAEPVARSPPGEPPDPEDLIKAIHDLENAASSDAVVREKIASLPPEVSDISLLEKIQNREGSEKLNRQVTDATSLLANYNNRLSHELEDRKQASRMLSDFTQAQREILANAAQKLEEYRNKLKKVNQVRSELKSHLLKLPDLTLLPSVTGGLAPLPSAGDLFNQP